MTRSRTAWTALPAIAVVGALVGAIAVTEPTRTPDSRPGGSSDRSGIVGAPGARTDGASLEPVEPWSAWIDGADERERYDLLLKEQDPAVLPKLEAGMRDAERGDRVRLTCARLLLAKHRLPVVEAALLDPRLDVRAIALETLGNLRHFGTEYVDNPSYEVEKSLLAWISDPNVPGRARGIHLMPKVFGLDAPPPPEFLAALRSALGPGDTADARDARVAAAGKLAAYKDCAAGPAILALSTSEPEPYVRWQILSSVVRLFDSSGRTCPDLVPEASVRQAVVAALSRPGEADRDRALRLGAMSVIGRHPTWAGDAVVRIREIAADVSGHEVDRRTALDTLVTLKDAPTLDGFERWCHDPTPGVRATATSSILGRSPGPDPDRLLSCVVGYLIAEPAGAYELTFHMAFTSVRRKAGEWVGLPGAWRTRGESMGELASALTTLVRTGSLDGTTRAQVGDALFRWLCETHGLADAQIDAAQATRAEFWAKARSGDVAGARAVYDASMRKNVNLWTYEVGWIEAHAK